jgi:hypothetical protein
MVLNRVLDLHQTGREAPAYFGVLLESRNLQRHLALIRHGYVIRRKRNSGDVEVLRSTSEEGRRF